MEDKDSYGQRNVYFFQINENTAIFHPLTIVNTHFKLKGSFDLHYDGTSTLLEEELVSVTTRTSRGTSNPQAPATSLEAATDPYQNQTPWILRY